MTTRRRFLAATIAAGGAATARAAPAKRRLDVPILGGTGFLGPHVVDAALARGHTMNLCNRGKTSPRLFPRLEKLHGDRCGDLSELAGRRWDAVIDTSGYIPSEVTRAAAELVTPAIYGALKAHCEQAAEAAMPGRATSPRAGLLVAPGYSTDRFTYWPARVARGGEVLAPGTPEDPLQFVDVRDVARFVVTCLERRHAGAFNVDAEPGTLCMGGLLAAWHARPA